MFCSLLKILLLTLLHQNKLCEMVEHEICLWIFLFPCWMRSIFGISSFDLFLVHNKLQFYEYLIQWYKSLVQSSQYILDKTSAARLLFHLQLLGNYLYIYTSSLLLKFCLRFQRLRESSNIFRSAERVNTHVLCFRILC